MGIPMGSMEKVSRPPGQSLSVARTVFLYYKYDGNFFWEDDDIGISKD